MDLHRHQFYNLLFVLLIFLLAGCTTSKWTVVDERAVNDTEEASVVSESDILVVSAMPTVERPVLRIEPRKVTVSQQPERVKIQRMVQAYKPKWGFSVLAIAGAAVAASAANSGGFLSGTSTTQRIGLNSTAVLLTTMAMINLQESGPPIETDEIRYLRQTGFDLKTDTVAVDTPINEELSITITHSDTVIFRDSTVQLSDNAVEINMGALATERSTMASKDSEFVVKADLNDFTDQFSVPLLSFMEMRFQVEEPVTQLRSEPVISQDNIIAEVGDGSSLLQIEQVDELWVKVEYGSVEAFVQKNAGSSTLRSRAESGPALLLELTDIPFGEIDVENSLPVLKPRNEDDRALIISGLNNNQVGVRQFADRDIRLFKHYMETSFNMDENQIKLIDDSDFSTFLPSLEFCKSDSGGMTVVYLAGFAINSGQTGEDEFALYRVNDNGEEQLLPLEDIFSSLAECSAEKLFVFTEIEYVEKNNTENIKRISGFSGSYQQRLANVLLNDFPNAFVLFGNREGQRSSVYSGEVDDDKRHHIFPYFLAEAMKLRKTEMTELYRHLENNVDYTSRRLHDRPQEVQGFGNFMLNLAE